MTFSSMLRVLRMRWRTVAAGLLVGLVVAGAVSVLLPRSYASSASVYVAGLENMPTADSDYYASSVLSAQRLASYRDLMVSERVLGPAAVTAGAPVDTRHVTVGAVSASAVLRLTATERDPIRAAAVANAVADQFTRVVAEVERPRGPAAPPAVTASVVDAGVPDAQPITPRISVNLLLGGLVGLLAAAVYTLLRVAGNTTVRSAEELGAASGLPVWGVLPLLQAGRDQTHDDDDAGREAVRRVRAHLTATLPVDGHGRLLVVVGPTPATGTTTVVHAVAGALAGRHRVAVVDANLRRPDMAGRYSLPNSPGLSDVLTGTTSVDQVAHTTAAGPDLVPAGGPVPDPGELLDGPALARTLDALRERYDVVLVDAPPLVPVVDAAVLAGRSDGVLLLAREDVTDVSELRSARTTLTQFDASPLAVVLTMSTTNARAYRHDPAPVPPAEPVAVSDRDPDSTSGRVVRST